MIAHDEEAHKDQELKCCINRCKECAIRTWEEDSVQGRCVVCDNIVQYAAQKQRIEQMEQRNTPRRRPKRTAHRLGQYTEPESDDDEDSYVTSEGTTPSAKKKPRAQYAKYSNGYDDKTYPVEGIRRWRARAEHMNDADTGDGRWAMGNGTRRETETT